MPYSFWIEETDYTATGEYEYFTQNSGYLQIQNTSSSGSETIELPFLWWFSNWSYYYNPYFYWWNGQLTAYEPPAPDYVDDLRFIKYEFDSAYGVDDFYYLIVPKTETDYFSNLDFVTTQLDEFDPTVTLSSWQAILGDDYQATGFTETELGICDLAGCPAETSPTPVPEASSVMGVLALGVAVVGVAIKRKFFPKQGAKAS
jgi:hypothetical protein